MNHVTIVEQVTRKGHALSGKCAACDKYSWLTWFVYSRIETLKVALRV